MTAPLQTRLKEIRHRVRRLLWINGLSLIVAVVFGSTMLIGFLDWLVHFNDPVVRFLLASGIVIASIWIACRYLILPLVRPLTDGEIAMRIERRFPSFKDSLVSTVQFMDQERDPRLGSPQLQQKVIEETISQIEQCDIEDVVESRFVYKAVYAAMAACILVTLISGLSQSAAAIAFHRLIRPFSDVQWPRNTVLRLLDSDFQPLPHSAKQPLRLARGSTLELFVENIRGGLPDGVSMQYRFEDSETVTERLQQTTLVDDEGRSRDVCVVRFVPTQASVKFRAVGGDDHSMPWYTLDVVPPPVVEDIQVTLTPPAYSEQKQENLTTGVGHVEGLLGTRVDIVADVNKSLKFGRIHVNNESLNPVELLDNGRRFKSAFVIREAGVYSYWFELKDRQDFEDPEAPRYEVRGIADSPPKVTIDTPSSDMSVTAEASLPLQIVAEDDLRLKDLRLQYQLSNRDADQAETIPFPIEEGVRKLVEVETTWELSKYPLVEGMQIVFHAEAEDFYELNGDRHISRSVTRTLTVVSAEEKKIELTYRQSELLENIERALKTQTRSHEQVGELQLQLQKTGQLRPEDIDLTKRIALDQKKVWSLLFNSSNGVETVNRQLQDELKQNNISDPEMERRLGRIDEELELLREDTLPQIEQSLTRVLKKAQTRWEQASSFSKRSSESASDKNAGKKTSKEIEKESSARSSSKTNDIAKTDPEKSERKQNRKSTQQPQEGPEADSQLAQLRNAGEKQAAAVESLEVMKRWLSRWQSRHDLTGELSELVIDQKKLNSASTEIGQETLTQSIADLTPQQQADLARLAERQRKQSQKLQKFREKLRKAAKKFDETDPSTADLLRDAGEQLQDRKIVDQLREAADRLERNDIGAGTVLQKEALKELSKLQDLLRNSGANNTESLVRQLKKAEEILQNLHQQQEELRQQVEAAQQETDPEKRDSELSRLQNEQQQLRRETAATARKLKRLRAYRPAESTHRAASRMKQAATQLEQQSARKAAQEQQEAVGDLQQARRELARSRRLAETQLADELLHQIADDLRKLAAAEQKIIEDSTSLLEQLRENDNRWSRRLLKVRNHLTDQQNTLKQQTDGLAEKVQAVEVFSLALRGASRQMQQVVDRLTERKVDLITIGLEALSRKRFLDLLAAFQTEPADGSQDQQPGQSDNQGEGGGRQGQQEPGFPQLIQLKMLKMLQEDLILRTAELNAVRQRIGKLSPALQTEREEITTEQGRLADLAQSLTQEFVETLEAIEEEMQEDR